MSETTPLIATPLERVGEETNREPSVYRVFKKRWYILFVLAVLNLSNGAAWISFSPIADYTTQYFSITEMQVNWLAMIYMVSNIPLGFAAMWFLDSLGLRSSLILAAWLNCVGCVLRVVACLGIPHGWQYPILLTGQGITGCAQPLILFAPTKLAALWFKENQRAVANMVGSMANPIGVMLGNLISPSIVTSSKHLPLLMEVYLAPAVLGALLATFGVWSSRPPIAPSASAGEVSEPFLQGLKKIVRIKDFLVLMVSYGGGIAIMTTLITLLEQILCPHGYTDEFVGLCGALMFGLGLLGAAGAAIYVDKTKKFEEVAKTCMSLSTVFLLVFLVVARYPHQEVVVAVLLSLLGIFGFALAPICLELGVECTYPVAEATSSGFIIVCGQLISLVLTIVMPVLARPAQKSWKSTCLDDPLDYTISSLLFSAVGAALSVFFTYFFKCEYRRLRSEEQIVAERILIYGARAAATEVNA